MWLRGAELLGVWEASMSVCLLAGLTCQLHRCRQQPGRAHHKAHRPVQACRRGAGGLGDGRGGRKVGGFAAAAAAAVCCGGRLLAFCLLRCWILRLTHASFCRLCFLGWRRVVVRPRQDVVGRRQQRRLVVALQGYRLPTALGSRAWRKCRAPLG